MASKQSTCWVIEHPEIGTAFVVADNWEQATVRAAEFWGVSWARTVSGMELVRRKDARKNISLSRAGRRTTTRTCSSR